MKLAEHVQHTKTVTHNAFDNLFARLGIRAKELAGEDLIPDHQLSKRAKILELIDNHKEEKDDYREARERALEELTFTLFNRIAAVKVMEAKTLFPEIITKRPENGDRSFQHKAWLEQNPNMRSEELEGLREFIKHAFNNLGEELALYHKDYPYALLPNTIDLNEIIGAFNAVEKDKDIDDRIWASDDILGWLYESYNNDKKAAFKEDGSKTEYDKVSLQSQVYTPRWVVEFLVNNSLGKLYLEMYPTSDIKNRKKIANAPQKQLRDPKPLHEVTLIDPAPGSGNFLLYAFDLFYELYVDQIEFFGADYDEGDIPKLIIENNLFGIDLDDRAVQLAQLGLYIKAKSKNRNTSVPSFHVVSSDFYLPDFETVRPLFEDGGALESGITDLLKEIWDDLQNAHKFGSLLKIEDRVNRRLKKFKEEPMDLFVQEEVAKYGTFEEKFFPRIRKAVLEHANGNTTAFIKEKTLDALTYLEILTQKYDVALANPPYTDSSDFGADLKSFINSNYKEPHKFHSNLYASFFGRSMDLTNSTGLIGMLHPLTFMYIKSFIDVRKQLLQKSKIEVLVELGLGGVFASSTVQVDVAMYVVNKSIHESSNRSVFIDLKKYKNHSSKPELFRDIFDKYLSLGSDQHVYELDQSKLKLIRGWPFIYWISNSFREKFDANELGAINDVATGLMTGDNLRHLRFFWEVDSDDISESYPAEKKRWVPFQKGGPYNKWYGNNSIVLNFKNDGQELATTDNKKLYFKEGVTYSGRGSKGVSFRYIGAKYVFSKGGPCIVNTSNSTTTFYLLGFLNSKITFYISKCLNPTVNVQKGDIERVPFLKPAKKVEEEVTKLVEYNVHIKKELYDYQITEPHLWKSPLALFKEKNLKDRVKSYLNYENLKLASVLISESIINDLVFQAYELTDKDVRQVLKSEGLSVGEYSVSVDSLNAFKKYFKDELSKLPKNFTKKLDELPKSNLAEKRNEFEGKFSNLYKKNNHLEEFCLKNEVNPINVWYWFKESGVVPQLRAHDIALEFLADLIREVLMEDEDGMIPLVRNAGEEILIDRLERKMREKGFSTAQISQFDGLLGETIDTYLNEKFFEELSSHLKLFKRLPATPFIWHLSSGTNKGFECYLVIYKWSRDNLLSLKSVYIEKRERALKNRLTDLGDSSDAASQNERDTIQKQLEEIEEFKQKIDDLIASGYDPILDDGVGKNIAPLQKQGMIPYDVLTKSQLKKYLNADW